MTTKTVNLYTFDELTEKAKGKARDWFRECESQDFGGFGELNEPIETAAKLIGIDFQTHAVHLLGGGTRYEPNVFWSLGGQGSGASFEGSYSYAKGSVSSVKAEFPTDTELNRIASELAGLQKQNGYRLACSVRTNGRDCHKYSMSIESDTEVKQEESLLELMRDFADWIYKTIQDEYDYRMSDESINESIRANEYTFTADGKREN